MSDKMRPVPFEELLKQALWEYRQKGSFFFVPVEKIDSQIPKVHLSGKEIESPIGPAAGPHTQLAQNIIAAYAAGARYFELKTVQIVEGESLGLKKPCIYVSDEAYNTEWSTELTVIQALEEYIKAWYLLKLLIKEFKLGDPEGFVFNMSVGYNLEGIKSEKIDYFIESMKDASKVRAYQDYVRFTIEHLDWFTSLTREYVTGLWPYISNTITLSTMHGCPAKEIESITTYLMEVKKLNTYLKCNPTLLGVLQVRTILDKMGYEYVTFDRESFEADISFEAVTELLARLQTVSKRVKVEFGVKLTNTFPVRIKEQELQGETMYMSGPALYPLTIGVAAKLSEAFKGNLSISYSGGADTGNIGAIYETGICPITVSTLLLKPGGYRNLTRLNKALADKPVKQKQSIETELVKKLAEKAVQDTRYFKTDRKKEKKKLSVTSYSPFCSKCRNCVEVCPNRANQSYEWKQKSYVLHQDRLCNECGTCSFFCILGHVPYKEKFTEFYNREDMQESDNDGFYRKQERFTIRIAGQVHTGSLTELRTISEEVTEILEHHYANNRTDYAG
ncbi:selenate reductase [Anaerocolumna sp. AGMB13025]|uniref:selenate reductase n=1 Tax=Anaerocolumna sp. AGMB13025 TaxID=3039116 RepID=UPI00241CD023|nr:selenate reductase [Anaerocolumna sp. AGMB13025]WFR57950.1 selenate reductase [Anaerocolumna sp. AGMB13025]